MTSAVEQIMPASGVWQRVTSAAASPVAATSDEIVHHQLTLTPGLLRLCASADQRTDQRRKGVDSWVRRRWSGIRCIQKREQARGQGAC